METENNKQALATTTSQKPCVRQTANKKEDYFPAQAKKLYAELTTTEQCISLASTQKTDSIGRLTKHYAKDEIKALLALHLINLNMVTGVKNPLNEIQIEFISDELVCNHKLLTMADIYLVLNRAAKGAYGELYENINPPKVLKWFSDYFDERCLTAQQMTLNASQNFKNSYIGTGIRTSENIKQNQNNFKRFKLEYEIKQTQK